MENLWRRFFVLVSVISSLIDGSYGYPVGYIEGNNDLNWLTLWPCLLSAALLFVATGAIGCCICCRNNQNGFKEFTDSGSTHSLTGCYTNAASVSSPANDFPPLNGSHSGGLISFEPLPPVSGEALIKVNKDEEFILKKPASFNTHSHSAQDWFDNPHDNFPRRHLKYICEYGKGWFGRVVAGEMFNLSQQSSNHVVVKILHGDATTTDQMYFLHEVKYLRDLTPHPNILALLGSCLETDPFLIILEGSQNGDLKTYLLENAEVLRGKDAHLRMAANIAQGLQFMHNRGFVHTDLAARNCVVDNNLNVKIGDYGTSTEKFKDDYYWGSDFALPIRWCAPETLHCTDSVILTKDVTTSANIWSFGILLWEICEFGRLPFPNLNDEEVIVKVLGERNCLPGYPTSSCLQATNLYHLMHLCWQTDKKYRPSASQVATIIEYIHQNPKEELYQTFEDFEQQWLNINKDNNVPVIQSVEYSPSGSWQDLKIDNSCCTDELHFKIKSPSLHNLHGSLEDLCSTPSESFFLMREKKAKCWLHQGTVYEQRREDEDVQFVQKISEAIRNLDDVLALERTSSSGSGTSPVEFSPRKQNLQGSCDKNDENGVLDFRLDIGNDKNDVLGDEIQGLTTNNLKNFHFDGKAPESVSLKEERGGDSFEEVEEACNSEDRKWEESLEKKENEEGGDNWMVGSEESFKSYKVKRKWGSVQDFMMLSHIEEGSEGNETGVYLKEANMPPCSLHSFGSVGDLRSVVIGEELHHIFRCICNKKGYAPLENNLLNSLEKCDENRSFSETPKNFKNNFSSSHFNGNSSSTAIYSYITHTTGEEDFLEVNDALLHSSVKKNEDIGISKSELACVNLINGTDCNLAKNRNILPQSFYGMFDSNSFSFLSSSKVESLSNLAKHCLSDNHSKKSSNDRMNCVQNKIAPEFIEKKRDTSSFFCHSDVLPSSERPFIEDSTVSDFPQDEEGDVGFSSGSQSTVECSSPLALSLIDYDPYLTFKTPVISHPSIMCTSTEVENKDLAKVMDTDFISSMDNIVKNKSMLIQPNILYSMELNKEHKSVNLVSNMNNIQDSVKNENVGVDVYGGANTGYLVNNDTESSHLSLNIVSLNSDGLQEFSNVVPFSVTSGSSLEKTEITKQIIAPEDNFVEKQCINLDAPNFEECDSAEDSVFDFSPNKRDSEVTRVLKVIERSSEDDGLLKQWTPDDERSSDSGFREKGSLSEDERGELEITSEDDIEGKGKNGDFWKLQLSLLRQADGETTSLVREASTEGSGWVKGEDWNVHSNGRNEESSQNRVLDEASLALLRIELEEKLGATNGRSALDIERPSSDEQLSDEEYEERTDLTIHYDAYLAQLSPILEEHESLGSSQLCSPAAKEGLCSCESIAGTALVNNIVENHIILPSSNDNDLAEFKEEILIVDEKTNKSSLMVISPIDSYDKVSTSQESRDSFEKNETEKIDRKEGISKINIVQKYNVKDDRLPQSTNSLVKSAIPTWSLPMKPPIGLPLLVPPPLSSAPMPSPEEEKASCIDRAIGNRAPLFREFEDIVALCQKKEIEEIDVQTFWEDGSSDGNDSSSSGEFVWKEGEKDLSVGNHCILPVPMVYDSEFAMDVIEEEDEETDDESLAAFVPSAWNCSAEPRRSSLRSPERKSVQKKNVSFKRQRYQCVYEYPKEEGSDSDGECSEKQMQSTLDYSMFADWELMEGDIPGEIGGEADFDVSVEDNNLQTQKPFDFYKLSSEDFDFGFADTDFMVSSTSRPFESDIGFPSLPGWIDLQDSAAGNVPDIVVDTISKTQCYKEKKEQLSTTSSMLNNSLGELRHTKDKLKLNLGHKIERNEDIGEETNWREEEKGEASVLDKEIKTTL